MNGVHDVGGMHGFGPVEREENEPLFHAEWEKTAVAIQVAALGQGLYNLDEFRHARERTDPADYYAFSYYESWMDSVGRLLVEKGVLTQDELDSRTEFFQEHPDAPAEEPMEKPPLEAPKLDWAMPYDYRRPGTAAPRFKPGDAVVAKNMQPAGHTRLSRYVRGQPGVVDRYFGVFVFPDSNAHGLGEQPQPLYSVRFEAETLWGESAEAHEAVYVDMWESYLLMAE